MTDSVKDKSEFSTIDDRVLWLDLETTGLVAEKTKILEVGAKVITSKFEEVSSFKRVVYYETLPDMDAWCLATHTKSGLLAECQSNEALPLGIVEHELCAWLDEFFPDNKSKRLEEGSIEGRIILTGTGIHFDRRYIRLYMPKLNVRLHHRMIDVTATYYAFKIFRPDIVIPAKSSREDLQHRSMTDIDDSINLCKALMGVK